jgi:hypothetical protein
MDSDKYEISVYRSDQIICCCTILSEENMSGGGRKKLFLHFFGHAVVNAHIFALQDIKTDDIQFVLQKGGRRAVK